VNDPQIWTLIGVFTAIMLGGMTAMTTLLMRAMTSAIGGLRGEMNGLRGEMNGLRGEMHAEIGGLRAEMNARFDTVETKIGHLDRDVGLLMRRAMGEAPEL